MVGLFPQFFVPLFLTFYVSAFTVVAPLSADVDAVNNVAANWTWYDGDPTKVLIHLFVNNVTDVCKFGRAIPIATRNMQNRIETATEVNRKKNGIVTYQVDKIAEYVLCAYEDVTKSRWEPNLTFITNSSVFSVSRSPIVQTTTVSGPSSSVEPTVTSAESSGAGTARLSGGIIAGAVIGGVFLAGLLVAVFVFYRRIRYQRRVIAFHKERMAITPPASSSGGADMTEKGYSMRTTSSFGDGHPRSPQSFSTQNTLQPLRRPPV